MAAIPDDVIKRAKFAGDGDLGWLDPAASR
jgi:hypothetical protein